MPPHELPSDILNSTTGLVEGMSLWAVRATEGWFFIILLLGFMAILLIGSARYGSARAFGFASVTGMLGATFLASARLIEWSYASMFIIVGLVGFAVLLLHEK